ncbi:MAG: hypothetical protein ACJAVV_002341 [Alphaproteobacteria bacterium]|jgi:hypothetical protein
MQSEHEKRAEAIFIEKQHYRVMSQTGGNKALLFNDMIKLASGASVINAKAQMEKVNQSLSARKQYIELCKEFSFDLSMTQAAASTGNEWADRETEKFSMKFKRDAENAEQVYVLLTILFPAEAHNTEGVTLNVSCAEQIYRIDFPLLDDNKTQMLFDISAPELLALANKDAEIIVA